MNYTKALRILKLNRYDIVRGTITPPWIFHIETKQETEAINYLCNEWDFAFKKKRLNKRKK